MAWDFLPSPLPALPCQLHLLALLPGFPSVLCTVKFLIQNNLIKCSGGTCCFQIDIQESCWPQTQKCRAPSQLRYIPQASKAPPSLQLSAASSLRTNHQGADGEARWRRLFVQKCSEEINSSAECCPGKDPSHRSQSLALFPSFPLESGMYPRGGDPKLQQPWGLFAPQNIYMFSRSPRPVKRGLKDR